MKLLMFVALLVSLGGASSVFGASPEACKVPAVDNIDIDAIIRLTSAPCFFTFDKLVTSLPERMRDTAVFISESQSLFKGCIDPLHPRIVYHTENLVLAVPWRGTTDVACQKVEVLGMSTNNKASLNPTLISFQQNSKVHVDTSGRACVMCHTNQFQPIWNSYPLWSGGGFKTYGFKDDNIVYASTEYDNFKKFFQSADQLKKMNWFGRRAANFLGQLSKIDEEAVKYAQTRDRSIYASIEMFMFPSIISFTDIPEDRQIVSGYSRKTRDEVDRLNRGFGIDINRLNAKRLANFVVDKLGAENVREELQSLDFCKVNSITEPRVVDQASRDLLAKLKALIAASGLDPETFGWSSAMNAPASESYYDGTIYSDQAFLNELLIKLGVQDVNITEYYDPPPPRTGPFYFSRRNQYSVPDHLFNSCQTLHSLLFK